MEEPREDVRLRVTEQQVLDLMRCSSQYLQEFLSQDPHLKVFYKEFVDNHPGASKRVSTNQVVARAGNVIGYNDTRVLVQTDLSLLKPVDLYVRFVANLVICHLKPGGIWSNWPAKSDADPLCSQALMILRYLESRGPVPNSLPASNEPIPRKPLTIFPDTSTLTSSAPTTDFTPPTTTNTVTRKPIPSKLGDLKGKRKLLESVATSPEAERPSKRKRLPINDGFFIKTFVDEETPELEGSLEEKIEILKKNVAARELKKKIEEKEAGFFKRSF